MISRFASCLLLAIAVAGLASCKTPGRQTIPRAMPIRFPKAGVPDGKPGVRKQIGTILMVNTEGKFVVVDSGVWVPPEAGIALKCMRDGVETGVLAVGAERRGGHVIADIVTGSPRKGDQVFQ